MCLLSAKPLYLVAEAHVLHNPSGRGHSHRNRGLHLHPVALNPLQVQHGGQNHAQRISFLKAQMVAVVTKILLLLLSLRETDQWVVFGYPLMQKMRHHHPQDMPIHETTKAGLQVHRGQE